MKRRRTFGRKAHPCFWLNRQTKKVRWEGTAGISGGAIACPLPGAICRGGGGGTKAGPGCDHRPGATHLSPGFGPTPPSPHLSEGLGLV